MTTKPWPWPGQSSEDKAKQIAKSYRGLAQRIAQGGCHDPAADLARLDDEWRSLGITWITPAPPSDIEDDDWLCAADLAQYVGRTPKDIYNWAHRGHILQRTSADGSPEYLVRSVIDYARRRHQTSKTADR